jgi:CBS domain containing-hemolysin-like protein
LEVELIILSLIASGFFSGIEIAFLTSNKLKIELLKKQGRVTGKLLSRFVASPSAFLATTLVGNNITLIVFGIMMAKLTEPVLLEKLPEKFHSEFYILIIQTLISSAMVLLIGEFIPKILFRINPDNLLQALALPLTAIYYLLFPFVYLVKNISELLLKHVFKVNIEIQKPVFSRIDLEDYVDQFVKSEENIKAQPINTNIFEKVLYLPEIKARECMVPRNEIEAIEINDSIEHVRRRFVDTKLSRLLVYEGNIDNIVGYVHHLGLLKNPKSVRSILFPVVVVPESMPARELLNVFKRNNKTIAWVVDEFGGTAGIITMEDLLEEIFGEIKDEHDEEELVEKQIDENDFIFAGRLEVDYLNDKYNLNIPEGDYETLSGYIISNHQDLPKEKEEIYIDHFKFEIVAVSEKRIEVVKLKVLTQ